MTHPLKSTRNPLLYLQLRLFVAFVQAFVLSHWVAIPVLCTAPC